MVASTSLSNQKPGFPGFRRQSASIPPLRYGTGFASPSNPCHDQREWQGVRESALFNKRVFEENSQRLGNAQSPNPCHDAGVARLCARAHFLINEFSKKTRRDWVQPNLLILCHRENPALFDSTRASYYIQFHV